MYKGCTIPGLVEDAIVIRLSIFGGLGLLGGRPTHVKFKEVVADVQEDVKGINVGDPWYSLGTNGREDSLGPEAGCIGRTSTMSPPPRYDDPLVLSDATNCKEGSKVDG